MRFLPLVLLFGFGLWPGSPRAQAPSKPPVACKAWGQLAVSVGAAWSDQTVAAWTAIGPYSIASTDRIAEVIALNTHGTQNLFLLLKANAAEATSVAAFIGAGAALDLETWGALVGTISVQGSGAATTGPPLACFVSP